MSSDDFCTERDPDQSVLLDQKVLSIGEESVTLSKM